MIRLVLRNLGRHPLRSGLTILGIAIALLAFGLIRTVITIWYSGVAAASPNRIIVRNAVSLIFPLPLAYRAAILAQPGVTDVTYAHWFGGIYIDERNSQFPQLAIDPATWFTVAPEYALPPEQLEAFRRERNAAVVGEQLAARFGWKLGDRVPMRGTIYGGQWDFVIRGIYAGARPTTDETQFLFHWTYLDERLRRTEPWRAGHVGWFAVRIRAPEQAAAISSAIDRRFANSLAETLTETEKAFVLGFISMSEAILVALRIVSIVIVGVILAVLANTMAMTARERTGEYAVLKTLGFGAAHVMLLVAGESLAMALIGGAAALALTRPAVEAFVALLAQTSGAMFPMTGVDPATYALSLGLAVLVGLAAAAVPTIRAARLSIVAGLRRVG